MGGFENASCENLDQEAILDGLNKDEIGELNSCGDDISLDDMFPDTGNSISEINNHSKISAIKTIIEDLQLGRLSLPQSEKPTQEEIKELKRYIPLLLSSEGIALTQFILKYKRGGNTNVLINGDLTTLKESLGINQASKVVIQNSDTLTSLLNNYGIDLEAKTNHYNALAEEAVTTLNLEGSEKLNFMKNINIFLSREYGKVISHVDQLNTKFPEVQNNPYLLAGRMGDSFKRIENLFASIALITDSGDQKEAIITKVKSDHEKKEEEYYESLGHRAKMGVAKEFANKNDIEGDYDSRIQSITELLTSDHWGATQEGLIGDKILTGHTYIDKIGDYILEERKTEGIDETILSPEQQAIKDDAEMTMMGVILATVSAEVSTGVVGAAGGVIYNIADFINNEDLALTLARQANPNIPDDYIAEKTVLDNIFTLLGIVPGVGAGIKAVKVAKLAKASGFKRSDIMSKMDTILYHWKGGEKYIDKKVSAHRAEESLNSMREIREKNLPEINKNINLHDDPWMMKIIYRLGEAQIPGTPRIITGLMEIHKKADKFKAKAHELYPNKFNKDGTVVKGQEITADDLTEIYKAPQVKAEAIGKMKKGIDLLHKEEGIPKEDAKTFINRQMEEGMLLNLRSTDDSLNMKAFGLASEANTAAYNTMKNNISDFHAQRVIHANSTDTSGLKDLKILESRHKALISMAKFLQTDNITPAGHDLLTSQLKNNFILIKQDHIKYNGNYIDLHKTAESILEEAANIGKQLETNKVNSLYQRQLSSIKNTLFSPEGSVGADSLAVLKKLAKSVNDPNLSDKDKSRIITEVKDAFYIDLGELNSTTTVDILVEKRVEEIKKGQQVELAKEAHLPEEFTTLLGTKDNLYGVELNTNINIGKGRITLRDFEIFWEGFTDGAGENLCTLVAAGDTLTPENLTQIADSIKSWIKSEYNVPDNDIDNVFQSLSSQLV